MAWEEVLKTVVVALVSAALGFMFSAARKISPRQLAEFEARAVEPICERLEKIENKVETFCTRGEMKETVQRIEYQVERNRQENREHFQAIYGELKQRRLGS